MENNEVNTRDFQALIEKYLDGKTTLEEVKKLVNYYESFQQNNEWVEELGPEETIKNRMLINILEVIQDEEPKKKSKLLRLSFRSALKYAAIILVSFSLGYKYMVDFGTKEIPLIVTKEEAVTLKLEDGNSIVLDQNSSQEIKSSSGDILGVQNQNKLVLNDAASLEEVVYNEINVPLGRRFEMVLADGTNVHLNAGSSLKFPTKFIQGQERIVTLKGEAYFDIAEDKAHPFIVKADHMNVRALGTEFNVTAYDEDETTKTVLVEGSVAVYDDSISYTKEHASILEPGYGAELNKSDNSLRVAEVDTEIYTSWRTGKIRFKNKPFKILRVKLERQYNVTIENNNEELEEQVFNIHFDREDINDVFKVLSLSYSIDYTVENNKIIIN